MTYLYKKIKDSGKLQNESERPTQTRMGIHIFAILQRVTFRKKNHSDDSVQKNYTEKYVYGITFGEL